MNLFVKGLPPQTQLLIAMGSAMAAGCQPCLERLVGLAEDEGLDAEQMQAAVSIGQFVKEQPARQMKEVADKLTGSRLSQTRPQIECPHESEKDAPVGCCAG